MVRVFWLTAWFLSVGALAEEKALAPLEVLQKASNPELEIDLDETLDAIEALKQTRDKPLARDDAVRALIKVLERQEAAKLSAGTSRVPPLMLLKSEAVRTLHHLGDPRAIEALKSFRAKEAGERYFPEAEVERALSGLSRLANEKKAANEKALPSSEAWRERWNTEQGKRFLALADQMANGSHGEAASARDALHRSGNPVVPFLTDCLLNHTHYVARRSSAYLLGQIDDPLTVPDLIKALSDPTEDVLWQAITSLGMMEDRRATEPILPFLDHELERIRVAAAQAMVRLKDPRTVDVLARHIQKYDRGQNRARAAEALGEIGDRKAMPVLYQTMTSPHIVTREFAAMSYGELATEEELEKLLDEALAGKLGVREVQLAFEEHYQADFELEKNASLQKHVESIRAHWQALKEGRATTTRVPAKSAIEQEMEGEPAAEKP